MGLNDTQYVNPIPSVKRSELKPAWQGPGAPTVSYEYPSYKVNKDLIRDSVITILLTRRGQRLFVPDFGSDIYNLIFDPNDIVLQNKAEMLIRTALGKWEPRALVKGLRFNSDENNLSILLELLIIKLNETFILPITVDRRQFASFTPYQSN